MGPTNFQTMHKTFMDSLKRSFKANNIGLLEDTFKSLKANEADKKSALDQSLRETLLAKAGDIPAIEAFITFAIQACRREMATATIPVVLLGDIFDAVTLDKCEKIFTFVEDNVAVWKEECFFAACKNNLLRMCNDLLRRLSRSQNTVFCGRILLFLAKFFPFSERSGLNIISEFNLENITEYGADGNDMGDQLGSGEESTTGSVKVDYNLYCKFWALQDFFRNPNLCYDTVSWKLFASHLTNVLSSFSSFKLDEPRGSKSKNRQNVEMAEIHEIEKEAKDSQHFFAKFLTNPKLLSLQLSDSNFRRSVLLQCLILFQYLNSVVKFKAENQCLTTAQTDWLKDTETLVYKLLTETPPNGKKFSQTVKHMLGREELWNNWKNDGCKEFKRPLETSEEDERAKPPMKRPRKLAGDLIKEATKNNKFYMGNPELTRLWNLCPDNFLACKGSDRNFVPTLEQYLESPKEKVEQSFEWRALRLLAMQSPHFFTLFNTTPTCKVSDYLDSVRKKIQKDKTEVKAEILEETQSQVDPQENEAETETFDTEAEQMESDLLKSEQFTPDDDKNVHKTHRVTKDQINELSEHIKEWKKLGSKFGYSADELLYFETENITDFERCRAMLQLWFDDDEDASLDNLAYILEGLGMLEASEEVKKMIEVLEKTEDVSSD